MSVWEQFEQQRWIDGATAVHVLISFAALAVSFLPRLLCWFFFSFLFLIYIILSRVANDETHKQNKVFDPDVLQQSYVSRLSISLSTLTIPRSAIFRVRLGQNCRRFGWHTSAGVPDARK